MKREDFEELVRLLRAWLSVAKDEEDRLRNPNDANDSGESLRVSWLNTRDGLHKWAKSNSPADVQAASDQAILGIGRLLRDDLGETTSLIPAYDGNGFSTAIEAFDFAARLAITRPDEVEIEFTYEGGSSIPGVGSIHEIDERLPWFVKRLSEEISHLEGGDIDASDAKSETKKKPRGKGPDSHTLEEQQAQLIKFLDAERIDLFSRGVNGRNVEAWAKRKLGNKSILKRGTVDKILGKLKDKARKLK